MPTKIHKPAVIKSAGNKPKLIEEYIGRVNSGTSQLSVAHVKSPEGWEEPGQKPEFDEYTVVLRGMLRAGQRIRHSIYMREKRSSYMLKNGFNTAHRPRKVQNTSPYVYLLFHRIQFIAMPSEF